MKQLLFISFFFFFALPVSGQAVGQQHNQVTAEEYAVYTAVLSQIKISPSDGKRAKLWVIRTRTNDKMSEVIDHVGSCGEDLLSPNLKLLLDDLRAKNPKEYSLARRFPTTHRYVLISQERFNAFFDNDRGLLGFEDYYKRFRHGTGFTRLSRVGFNANRSQAIVCLSYNCSGICAYDQFWLLSKVRGRWKTIKAFDCDPRN
jgi:hypothetical protein